MTGFSRTAALAAVFAAGTIVNAGSAMSTEIVFGELTPTISNCSYTSGDSGVVCDNGLTFTASGAMFTATGFNEVTTSDTALTLKIKSPSTFFPDAPRQSFQESGLGENDTLPPSACTDVDCEMHDGTGMTIRVNGGLMNDVIIGSVQNGEGFFFLTDTGFSGFFTGGEPGCTPAPGTTDTCLITFPDTAGIAVVGTQANVLVTAVSGDFGAVPEPGSMALLGSALLGFGLLRRGRA